MTLDPASNREAVAVAPQSQSANQTTQPDNQTAPADSDVQTKPIVGIIYPPPEHRNIIDKTAMFVARNGPDFEEKVRQNEISNTKFNFFNLTDPYHAYYQHKIKEFREGKAAMEQSAAPLKPPTLSSAVQAQQEKIKQQIVAEMAAVPKEAPPEYEFMVDPPSISSYELDIVKLTAQFVARNGRHFLTQLMNREQRNPQFDFLRPQHGMFQYFTKLVEQYTKVLIPPKDLIQMLERQSISVDPMVEEVKRRAEWRKHIEKQKQREADEREKERVAYAQIDWHDFVIVETVDFQPHETLGLPPPVTPGTVGARVIHQQRVDEKKKEGGEDDDDSANKGDKSQDEIEDGDEGAIGAQDMDLEDMEESDEEEEPEEEEEEEERDHESPTAVVKHENNQPPQFDLQQSNQPSIQPITVGDDGILIRKDYDPKLKANTAAQSAAASQLPNYVINEITGEKVPIDKMNQHMKYNLLDPRWLEEKNRQQREKQQQEEVFPIGNQIGDSLKQFSERRTDIFGPGYEETIIGRKLGEEEDEGSKRDERAIWDGHTGSVESTTKRVQANITIQDQIDAIHKAKGLSEDSSKEKIGPQRGGSSEHNQQSDSSLLNPSFSSLGQGPTTTQPSLSTPAVPVRLPAATPLLLPMVPVVQRPPVVPVFNPNPSAAAAMLGAQAAMLRPSSSAVAAAGLVLQQQQQQSLAVAALAAQQQANMAAAVQANAEKSAAQNQGVVTRSHGASDTADSHSQMGNEDGPPSSKKQKTEADLIPEDVFLNSTPSPTVKINVVVPTDYSKPEWNLNGQTLSITLPYKDYVSVVKEKIYEQLTLPAGKQKLIYDGMFIKDSNTLAFYNMPDNCNVVLQLKERGGRKK